MKRHYIYHAVIALGVLCAGFLFWWFTAPSGQRQFTVAELREMLREGETPEERALGAAGLGARDDLPSVPLLLAAMEDESPAVRARASAAVVKVLGTDFYFKPNDPPEKRAAVVERYQSLWQTWKEKTNYSGEEILPTH